MGRGMLRRNVILNYSPRIFLLTCISEQKTASNKAVGMLLSGFALQQVISVYLYSIPLNISFKFCKFLVLDNSTSSDYLRADSAVESLGCLCSLAYQRGRGQWFAEHLARRKEHWRTGKKCTAYHCTKGWLSFLHLAVHIFHNNFDMLFICFITSRDMVVEWFFCYLLLFIVHNTKTFFPLIQLLYWVQYAREMWVFRGGHVLHKLQLSMEWWIPGYGRRIHGNYSLRFRNVFYNRQAAAWLAECFETSMFIFWGI